MSTTTESNKPTHAIWQVHGKSRVTFSEWMRMDLRYIGARTFVHDAKLVLHTLLQIMQRKASH